MQISAKRVIYVTAEHSIEVCSTGIGEFEPEVILFNMEVLGVSALSLRNGLEGKSLQVLGFQAWSIC